MTRYLAALLLIGLISCLLVFSLFGQPVNISNSVKSEFLISPGQNLDQVAANLSQAKLIRSRLVFKITVFRYNLANKIQAGYFYLSPSQNTAEIVKSLTRASAKQVWVTIPEGLRREEIANLILDKLEAEKMPHNFDPEDFIAQTTRLEGHLFPDTYAFGVKVTTGDVIEKLTTQFNKVVTDLKIPAEKLNRVVILASIVEREAGRDEERPEVAAILFRRAQANSALSADAAVQYAIASARCRLRICDWWPKSLTKTDLAIDSPFNTYRHPGLPPSPISNPGRTSLKASIDPKTTKYWFYLHDANGQIHYASTLEEHNQNVCTYLKKDC